MKIQQNNNPYPIRLNYSNHNLLHKCGRNSSSFEPLLVSMSHCLIEEKIIKYENVILFNLFKLSII